MDVANNLVGKVFQRGGKRHTVVKIEGATAICRCGPCGINVRIPVSQIPLR